MESIEDDEVNCWWCHSCKYIVVICCAYFHYRYHFYWREYFSQSRRACTHTHTHRGVEMRRREGQGVLGRRPPLLILTSVQTLGSFSTKTRVGGWRWEEEEGEGREDGGGGDTLRVNTLSHIIIWCHNVINARASHDTAVVRAVWHGQDGQVEEGWHSRWSHSVSVPVRPRQSRACGDEGGGSTAGWSTHCLPVPAAQHQGGREGEGGGGGKVRGEVRGGGEGGRGRGEGEVVEGEPLPKSSHCKCFLVCSLAAGLHLQEWATAGWSWRYVML